MWKIYDSRHHLPSNNEKNVDVTPVIVILNLKVLIKNSEKGNSLLRYKFFTKFSISIKKIANKKKKTTITVYRRILLQNHII